jgi:arsenite-transporting ATPase
VSKRLVLLSGTPRAGTSTLAEAAVRKAGDQGYRTSFISVDQLDADALRRVMWPHIADTLRLVMPHLDLANRDSADFVQLPGVDELLALREIAARVTSGADIVVVDAGNIDRLIASVGWLETVDDLLDLLQTAQFVEGEPQAPEVVTTLRAQLADIRTALFDTQTTVRIVTTPDDAEAAARAIAGLSLIGLHVDGVIVNKVPRAKDGWPKPWLKDQRAKARRAVDLFGDLPVRRVRLAAGRISVSLAKHFGLDTAWTEQSVTAVQAVGDGYHWVVPFLDPLDQPVRVGYRGDGVYVEVGQYRRRLRMPSVVQRCVITEAQVRPGTLTLICQPNPEVWPK